MRAGGLRVVEAAEKFADALAGAKREAKAAFAKVGVLVTLIGYLSMLLFAMTWWRWLGWI